MIRVLVADDETLIRSGFRMLLDTADDIEVVAEATDGREAVTEAQRCRPDVVLMDVRMPRLDGIAATAEILALPPPNPYVLMLTTFDRDELVHQALRSGASGFVLKSIPPDRLLTAVRDAAAGQAALAPEITQRLIQDYIRRPAPDADQSPAFQPLTSREREVLIEVAAGHSNIEIAQRLHLSETTVKTYVTRILSKLGVRDRAQAVVFAYETGLVRPGDHE